MAEEGGMTKKPNALMAALAGAAEPEPPPLAPATVSPARKPQARHSREGKHLIATHVTPKVLTALKILAAEERKTQQQLIEEALGLLFVKKGRGDLFRD
jgi:hypothetical protein